MLPAHCLCCASFESLGGCCDVNVSIAVSSSKFHVLPMLKLPLLFSLALCMRTRPVLLTAMMINRGFLLESALSGGGGLEGYCESSTIRMCVI